MTWYSKITVEVPLFFTYINFLITGSIFTNLVVYRSCYVLLQYNKTDCAQLGSNTNEDTQNLEKLVEPTADIILMVKNLVDYLFPCFFCMLAGPWSDKYGRKPVLLLSLIGLGISPLLMIILSYFENLNPWYFLIAFIPPTFTGGSTTYFAMTLSYLSDISTKETRGMRMAFYEVALASGILVGSTSSSYIFYASNYESIFATGTGCMLIGILYTIFLIPESLQIKKETNNDSDGSTHQNIDIKYFVDMVYTSIKKRENYDRPIILLTILSTIIYMFQNGGDYGILFIFLRARLQWTLRKYTLYFAAHNILCVVGAIIGTFVLHKLLKIRESILSLVGLTSVLCCVILQLVGTTDMYIYIGGVIKCLGSLISPMLRSQVSRMVPANEVGKIFAMIVGVGSLISLGASPAYTLIYNATLNVNPAAFNFLSIGLLGMAILLVMVIMILEYKTKYYSLTIREVSRSTT